MSRAHYSSVDFGAVPDVLEVNTPSRLIHKNVAGGSSEAEQSLSGRRHHFVRVVDLPSKVMSMTIGGLDPEQSTRRHRHNYETLIYVLSGKGKSTIEGEDVFWEAGDAFYVPVWAWHQHINLDAHEKAMYVACENAPHLQNLGIALREEA